MKSIFVRFVCRFGIFALLTGEVEAVLTGHIPYDSVSGCIAIALAALLATVDHYLPDIEPVEGAKKND